jgi:putative peptide zinc metalloprotease protein
MGLHWTQTTASWHQGDAAAVVQSAGETALVAMPILGIFYLLGRIARRSAGAMWRVTGGRPLQRSLAIAGAAGMLALVAWAWWPDHQYRPIQGDEAGPVPTILAPAPTPYPTYVQPTVVGIPAPAITSQTMVALIPSTPVDTLVTIIEEQAHSGARVAIPDEGGWPFPFDRPAPPGPGDNRAEAFNTSDDSFLSDIATALLIVTDGDPVRQGNEAYAFASCRDCTTIAIAMQVILIVGSSDEIIPINAAGALNYDCRRCATYASAYQLALSVAELPSGRILGEIGAVLDRVEHLPLRSISGDDIDAALEDAKNDMLDIVAQSVILAFQQSRADSQVASADDLDDGSAATDLSEPSTPPTATTARAAVRSTATSPTSSETTTATSDPEDSATNAAADDPTATTTTPTPNSTSDSTDPSTGG